jgi:hypothetical protein
MTVTDITKGLVKTVVLLGWNKQLVRLAFCWLVLPTSQLVCHNQPGSLSVMTDQ